MHFPTLLQKSPQLLSVCHSYMFNGLSQFIFEQFEHMCVNYPGPALLMGGINQEKIRIWHEKRSPHLNK